MGSSEQLSDDSNGKYSEEYRHFDTLIWQAPAWCTAIFLVTVVGLNSITDNNAAVASTSLDVKSFAMGFVAIMFALLLVLTHVLYRFRIHQSRLKKHGTPFWASASTYIQTLVTAQAMGLMVILLLLCSVSLLWSIFVPVACLIILSIYRETQLRR